jgi:hypothetical protein
VTNEMLKAPYSSTTWRLTAKYSAKYMAIGLVVGVIEYLRKS